LQYDNVLGQSFVDAAAVTEALKKTATLLILDNLESVSQSDSPLPVEKEGDEKSPLPPTKGGNESSEDEEEESINPLFELLTVAAGWSETGACRVLLTTRQAQFNHFLYPATGSIKHQMLPLSGLSEHDALQYFQHLVQLPPQPKFGLPTREAILDLFKQVQFHPLSIGLIAGQVKLRKMAELGKHLEKILEVLPDNMPQYEKSLLASLNLSLEKLEASVRRWLPRLGIFQGGAMEDMILKVTGLGKVDEDPEIAKNLVLL